MRTDEEIEEDIIEQLAELEHQQWVSWAEKLLLTEELSQERINRWVPLVNTEYRDLTEEEKELDRIWARKVFEICMQIKIRKR